MTEFFCQLSVVGACRDANHREGCYGRTKQKKNCCCDNQCANCRDLKENHQDLLDDIAEFELGRP